MRAWSPLLELGAKPFYARRIAIDGVSKKLIVQIAQADTGKETTLEIPPGECQAIAHRLLNLALATNTPVFLAIDAGISIHDKLAA